MLEVLLGFMHHPKPNFYVTLHILMVRVTDPLSLNLHHHSYDLTALSAVKKIGIAVFVRSSKKI